MSMTVSPRGHDNSNYG